MIGSVRGRIVSKTPPQLMVEAGGLGYELEAPMSTFFHLPAVGEEVRLLTHLVVREDAHVLYAFGTEDERRLFRSLIKVSGVGPKIALALLSGISVEAFALCVQSENVAALIKVPGIGRKTAERLVVEMRDRLEASGGGAASAVPVGASPEAEAFGALVALGYKPGGGDTLAQGRGSGYTFHRRADPPRPEGRGAGVDATLEQAERPIGAEATREDEAVEKAIRPRRLAEYVGQPQVKAQLDIFITAARQRAEALDHVLIFGPPGLGKTTLANIIAAELGRQSASDLGSGARASRRSRRDSHQPAAARRALRR